MSIFARGTAPKLLRLGTEHVLRAMLDGVAIWDGTVPAQVSVPRALASASAPVPVVSSTPNAIVAPAAAAAAAGPAPSVTNSSSVTLVVATASAGATAVPAVSADAGVLAVAATSSASAIPILSDANVSVPTASASAAAPVPGVETTGSTIVVPPAAAAMADAPVPMVSASMSVAAPTATASAAAAAPVVSGGASVTAPAASASADAAAPAVAAVNFAPSGMTKNGTSSAGTGWGVVPNWSANTGTYPGSSVDGTHGLVVQGSKTNASLSASVPYTGAIFGTTHRIRLVDQSGNVLVTGANVGSGATSGTCTASASGVNLTGVTAIRIQMDGSSASGTITSGATCNLTIT